MTERYYAVITDGDGETLFTSKLRKNKEDIISLIRNFKDNILNAEIEDETN